MRRIVYDARALDDIDEIVDWLEDKDPAVAARFIDAAFATAEWLADVPLRAAKMETPGVPVHWRRFPVRDFEAYALIHVTSEDVLEVVRVVHGTRDLPAALAEPDA